MRTYRIYYRYFELATGHRGDHRVELEAESRQAAEHELHASRPGQLIKVDEIEIRGSRA